MKYLFILGRNIELSVLEIKSFFERENINFRIVTEMENGLLVETQKKLSGIVEKLGGTISMGEVLAEGNLKDVLKEIDKKQLYETTGNKLNYVVFDFDGVDYDDILAYLKERFKDEKLKATHKKLTGNISLQKGKSVPNVSSRRIDEQYFVFGNSFGRITEKYDYEKAEKRDMEKPVRRSELSISPRLAKILVNISQARKGETLLDPFCGVGTILQEALLQEIKAAGIDRDKKAIASARENLKWMGFKEKDYRLIKGDSSIIGIPQADAIATEPDLGELHKKVPSEDKAKEIIGNFESMIIKVLNNAKGKVRGRIVLTMPFIRTIKKRISCNFEKIANETRLRILAGPIHEFRENSIVGRSILVLKE